MPSENIGPLIKDPSVFSVLSKIHKQAVLECCFSPDSEQLLTGSEDHTVVLWDFPTNVEELHDDTINDEHKLVCYRLSDHKSPVMAVAMHRKIFISASKDGHVKLWRLVPENPSATMPYGHYRNTFKKPNPDPCTYKCHTSIIRSVTFSHDARCFATSSDDRSVKIWSTDCKNKMLASYLGGHFNWIKSVRWAKTNDFMLASCGDDGKICIWDSRLKFRQAPIEIPTSGGRRMQFNCLDWHPVFYHHIATGAQDSSCVVWDLRNKKKVQVYAEHNGSVNSIAFNSGGSLLLSGSGDKTSKIFDVCEGRNMFTLKSHSAPITSVCFNTTGEMFATGSQDKTVHVWKRNFDTINIVCDDTGFTEQDESSAEYNTVRENDEYDVEDDEYVDNGDVNQSVPADHKRPSHEEHLYSNYKYNNNRS